MYFSRRSSRSQLIPASQCLRIPIPVAVTWHPHIGQVVHRIRSTSSSLGFLGPFRNDTSMYGKRGGWRLVRATSVVLVLIDSLVSWRTGGLLSPSHSLKLADISILEAVASRPTQQTSVFPWFFPWSKTASQGQSRAQLPFTTCQLNLWKFWKQVAVVYHDSYWLSMIIMLLFSHCSEFVSWQWLKRAPCDMATPMLRCSAVSRPWFFSRAPRSPRSPGSCKSWVPRPSELMKNIWQMATKCYLNTNVVTGSVEPCGTQNAEMEHICKKLKTMMNFNSIPRSSWEAWLHLAVFVQSAVNYIL